MILDDMIYLIYILQITYRIQTHTNNLILQTKFKALLAREVFNFIPKTPRLGIGRTLTLNGYSSGLA